MVLLTRRDALSTGGKLSKYVSPTTTRTHQGHPSVAVLVVELREDLPPAGQVLEVGDAPLVAATIDRHELAMICLVRGADRTARVLGPACAEALVVCKRMLIEGGRGDLLPLVA